MTAGDPLPAEQEPEPTASALPKEESALTEDTAEQNTLMSSTANEEELALSAAVAATAHMTLLPGYELLGLLGRGGTSVVYKARHSNLRRLVALKMILGGAQALPEQLMRFRIEAETVARLQHLNIVQIYEVGVYETCTYLALEYVEGRTINEKYAGAPAPIQEAARIVEAVARGVHHAHERGVVHRDLKPANVLLTKDGTPKITDFGLAKLAEAESMPSLRMSIQGTPSYMAPEQASLERDIEDTATMAVDIYALGAILYELLTGNPPFQGHDLKDTLRMVLEEEPVPPRRLNSTVPEDLELICLKCLHKNPHMRYPTAEILADDLLCFLHQQPILARPTTLSAFLVRWRQEHPHWCRAVIGAGLLAVALFGTALGYAWWWHRQWRVERERATLARLEAQEWHDRVRRLLDYNLLLHQNPEDTETLWKRAQLFQQLNENKLALADCQTLLGQLSPLDSRRKEVQQMITALRGNALSPALTVPE